MNSSSTDSNINRSVISFNDITPSFNIDHCKVLFFPKFMNCLFYNEHSIIIVDLLTKTIAVKLTFPNESISHIKIINSNTIAYIKHFNSYDQIIVTNLTCLDEFCELKIKEKVYDFIFDLNESNNYIFYILTKEETFLLYNDNVLITSIDFGSLLKNSFNNISFSLIKTIQLFHIDRDLNLILVIFQNGQYIILKSFNQKIVVDYNQKSFERFNDVQVVKVDKFEYYCKEEKNNWIYFLVVMNYIHNNEYNHLISIFNVNVKGECFHVGNIIGDYIIVDSYRYGNDSLDKHFLYCVCSNNNNYFINKYDIINFIFESEDEMNQNSFQKTHEEIPIKYIKESVTSIGITGISLVPLYGNDINNNKEYNYSEFISFDIITKLFQNNCAFTQITFDIAQQNEDIVTTDVDKFISYCDNHDTYIIKQALIDKWKQAQINIYINVNDPWEKIYLIYLIYCGNIFAIQKYCWLRDNKSIDNYLVSTEIIENTYKYMENMIKEQIKQQIITQEIEKYIKILLKIAKILQHRTCTPNKKPFNSEQIILNEASIINSNRIFELENYLLLAKLNILQIQYNFKQLDLDNVNYLHMFSMIQNKSKLKSCNDFIDAFIEMTSLSDDTSTVVVPLYKTLFYTKFILFLYYYFSVKNTNELINENEIFSFCYGEYEQFHLICEVIFNLDKNENKKLEITDTIILAFVNLFTKLMENIPNINNDKNDIIINESHIDFIMKLKELPFKFIKALGENGYTNEAFYLGYGIRPYITEPSMKEKMLHLINSFNIIPFLSDLN